MVIVYANDENGSVDNVLGCDRLQLTKRSSECFYESYLVVEGTQLNEFNFRGVYYSVMLELIFYRLVTTMEVKRVKRINVNG